MRVLSYAINYVPPKWKGSQSCNFNVEKDVGSKSLRTLTINKRAKTKICIRSTTHIRYASRAKVNEILMWNCTHNNNSNKKKSTHHMEYWTEIGSTTPHTTSKFKIRLDENSRCVGWWHKRTILYAFEKIFSLTQVSSLHCRIVIKMIKINNRCKNIWLQLSIFLHLGLFKFLLSVIRWSNQHFSDVIFKNPFSFFFAITSNLN